MTRHALENLMDAIADSIATASDEEILEDARLAGIDVEQTARETKALLLKAVSDWEAKQ